MAHSADREENLQLIGFYAGHKLYGTNILAVREILREPEIEAMDTAPGFINGMVRLRGENIPVVQLNERLNNDVRNDPNGIDWVLITKAGDQTVGYIVDSVTRILKIEADQILPAPDLVLAGLRSQYIIGVCKSELGLLVVLDLNRILAEEEIKSIKKNESFR